MATGRYRKLLTEGLKVKDVLAEWFISQGVRTFFLLLVGVLVLGTLVYWVFGDLSFIDAAYMSVITASTVGYGDTAAGAGSGMRLFTVLYVMLAVLVFSVTMSRIAALLVEGRIRAVLGRKRMEQQVSELRNHIILCGYGRFGQITGNEIREADVPLVVIDEDPRAIEACEQHDILGLVSDATEEETLVKAGLEHARALLCSLPSDADNVYTILTARELRPDIPIVALARDRNADRKLMAAGATNVISPYEIGATHMARMILSPNVAQVVQIATGSASRGDLKRVTQSTAGVRMEEIVVIEDSLLDGVKLKDSPIRKEFGVIIVAVIDADGKRRFNPDPDVEFHAGNVLVGVGPPEGMAKLRKAMGG